MKKAHRLEIEVLVGIIIILLLGGTVFYNQVENLNYTDAFYLSSITLTTVGYGDLAPQTNTGRIFTSFYVLFGVGILLESLNLLAKMRIEKSIERVKQVEKPKKKK